MADRHVPGPWEYLVGADGQQVPLYIIRFDERGECRNEQSREILLAEAGGYSDVFVFSHGWNNEWSDALGRYRGFFKGYAGMRKARGLPTPKGYRPLLVGIFWPSAALAFGEQGVGPQALGLDVEGAFQDEAQYQRELAEIADFLETEAERTELHALAQEPVLTGQQARRLAELAAGILRDSEAERESGEPAEAEGLLRSWEAMSEEMGRAGMRPDAGPVPAGVVDGLSPLLAARWLIRMLTVAIMKDRAGVVGAKGVGPLLEALLRGTGARVHLIGHSYGAKVLLSALCGIASPPRKVRSALLLQPAVSHLCFAGEVPGKGHPGGYRQALERVEQPILATYSPHDFALHTVFHWALRRDADLGELMGLDAVAAVPSRYAALGGYGPRRAGERLIPIQAPGEPYVLDPEVRVYGLDGANGRIPGHGDISNEFTWWALHALVAGVGFVGG